MAKIVPLTLLLAVLLSLVVFASTSPNYFTATAQWLTSYVSPGEKLVPLQVTLKYTGSFQITNVEIIPVHSPPFLVSSSENYTIQSVEPGQEFTLIFIGNITPNIPLGIYNFCILIDYTYNGVRYAEPVSVQIPILGYVELYAVSQTSGVIFPGEQDVPITLTIYNTGTVTATNVTLLLNSTYPLKFITRSVNIPIIPSGGSASTIVFADVYDNASIGLYKIPITALVYGSEYYSLNMSIVINSNQSVSGKVISPLITLVAGPHQLDVPINLQLLYTGPVPIDSYSIKVYLPKGFTNTTGGNIIEVNGGPLSPNELLTVPLTVNINNVSLGTFTIPIEIIWNAVEGDGDIVSVVQYSSFTLALMGNPNLEVSLSSYDLTPGTLNDVYLIITNNGSGKVYNLTLTISSPLSIIGNLPEISYLNPGQSIEIPLKVYVPASYEGNAVQLTVNINYLNSAYQQSNYVQELGVYISFAQGPSIPIIVSLNPDIIYSDTFTPSQLILTNTLNTTLYNISLTISSSIYVNYSDTNIYEIKPNSQVSIPITISSQNSGSFSISILVTYYENGVEREEQLSIPIYVMQSPSSNAPILIGFSTTTLTTAKIEYTYLVISNTLSTPLDNVTITLSPQGELYINTTVIYLPALEPLQKVEVPVEVYTESSGIVSLGASITYYQDGIEKQTQEIIESLAAGSVELVITGITSVPTVATRGSIVSVTATLYNFGTGSADGLVVTVFPARGIEVIGQNTYYVGDLAPDTSSTFTFAFRILNNTQPGIHVIPVEFTYTNDIGQVLHSRSNISIIVSNGTFTNFGEFSSFFQHHRSSNSILPYLVTIIIVVVVIIALILVLRRRRGGE